MTTDRILGILQKQVGVDKRSDLREVKAGEPKVPLEVSFPVTGGSPIKVKLYLILVNGQYWLTNFQTDDDIYVRQNNEQVPTFKELVSKVAAKYLDQEVEAEFKGVTVKVPIQNVVLRVGYKEEGKPQPVEEIIAIKNSQKDPAVTQAEVLDGRVIVARPKDEPKPTAAGKPEEKDQQPQRIPNNHLSNRPEPTQQSPADYVGPQETTTQGKVDVPVQASPTEIRQSVRNVVESKWEWMAPFAMDQDGDGDVDQTDVMLWYDKLPDNDKDGVPDDIERFFPWCKSWMNPDKSDLDKFTTGADYDNDGVPDWIEWQQGTNPNDPNDNGVKKRTVVTTQTVTFTGDTTQLSWYGSAVKQKTKIETTYTLNPDGSVQSKTEPEVEPQDPDLVAFSQLKYRLGGYFSHPITSSGDWKLKYSLDWQDYSHRWFHQPLGFDDIPVYAGRGNIDLTWQINPRHMLLTGPELKLGNPFSHFAWRLGGKHDLSDLWSKFYVDWMVKAYAWRSTGDVFKQRLQGNYTVDETTTVSTEYNSGGVYDMTYSGQSSGSVDRTNPSTYRWGNEPSLDGSLRFRKIYGLGPGYGNLVLTLNPIYQAHNDFGAHDIFHNITGIGLHGVGSSAIKFDLGVFHRYSGYDGFARHNNMFNPYANLYLPGLGGLAYKGQYWLNLPSESPISQSHGTSHELSYPITSWMRAYASYRWDQHFGFVDSLDPRFGSPSSHMVLGGVKGTLGPSPQHRVSYDVYGGGNALTSGPSGLIGGGSVGYDGQTGPLRYGVYGSTRYDHVKYTETGIAEDPDDILDPTEVIPTPAGLAKEAKAAIIEKLKVLAFIKEYIFSKVEIKKDDASYKTLISYIGSLPDEAFAGFKFSEDGLEGDLLAAAKRFNALDAAGKKAIVLKLFEMKKKGLLFSEDCDGKPGEAGLCGAGTDLGISDIFAMQLTAHVMGGVAEAVEAEIRKIAALSMGYDKGYEKASAEAKEEIDKEVAKIVYDEDGENVAHYKDNFDGGKSKVALETDRYLRADITAAREKITEAEKALEKLLPAGTPDPDQVVKGIFTKDVDLIKLLKIEDTARFTKVKDVADLIDKLKAIEAKLEPLRCEQVVAKALAAIEKARVKLEKLRDLWVSMILIQGKMNEIITLVNGNLTVDIGAKLKELNALMFGTYVSGPSGGSLKDGFLQRLIAYYDIDPDTITEVKFDGAKNAVNITDVGSLKKGDDVWDGIFWLIHEEDDDAKTRSIFQDRYSGLVFSTLIEEPDFYEWFYDVWPAGDKYAPYDPVKWSQKLSTVMTSDEQKAMVKASIMLCGILKSGKYQLPKPIADDLTGYVRFNYWRANLAGETPTHKDQIDRNLFALVYKAEASTIGEPLDSDQVARVRYVITNMPELNRTGWDKILRFLYIQDPANFQQNLKTLIEKGFKVKGITPRATGSFKTQVKSLVPVQAPKVKGKYGNANQVLTRFLELLQY